MSHALVVAGLLAGGTSAGHAQAGGAPPVAGGPMGMAGRPPMSAGALLARTGPLQLTDAQVVRLAAIARREEDRRRRLRASMDSLRASFRAGGRDSLGRGRPMTGPTGGSQPQLAAIQRERDAMHADLRDALAVLTVDQQALLWENGGAGRRAPMGGPGSGARGGNFRGRGFAPGGQPDGGGARPPE
jgi:hypothetical protein